MYPKSFSLFSSVLFITLPISSAYASYDATTNTETLTNQRISNTMGDVSFHSKCKVWGQRTDTVQQFKEPGQRSVPRIF